MRVWFSQASLKAPRPPDAPLIVTSSHSINLAKDGDDFVLDVAVYLAHVSERILESQYRFPLRRVHVSESPAPETEEQCASLQQALDEIKWLGALISKLEKNQRLQALNQELNKKGTQLRAMVEKLEEVNKRLQQTNRELATRVSQQQIAIDQLGGASSGSSGVRGSRRQHQHGTYQSPPRRRFTASRGTAAPPPTEASTDSEWPSRFPHYRQNRFMPRK